MASTLLHICMQTEGAPSDTDEHEIGDRWVCSCGDHFVYREGFTRSGHASLEWWYTPAVPAPRPARRGLLFGPRKG